MFTGIVETIGMIEHIVQQGDNLRFRVNSKLAPDLNVDQSVSHDGVCLTVVARSDQWHEVQIVTETLSRTTLSHLNVGSLLNLERAMVWGSRLDGHLVQGHVDSVGQCISVQQLDGSRLLTFSFGSKYAAWLVDKGSIALNGVSLTLIDPTFDTFSVALIPYTLDHTTLGALDRGDSVNIEFDILGKYLSRLAQVHLKSSSHNAP